MKVLLNTHFSRFSGYGNDGIGLAQALLSRGIDLYVQPMHVAAPLPKELANLMTKGLNGPFDLTIQHVEPRYLYLEQAVRMQSEVTVGMSMWEYSSLDNLIGRSTFAKRSQNFDAILAYDQVSHDGFKERLPKDTKVGVLQGGYEPSQWEFVERDWHSDRFGFCMVGQLHDRKDPFLAVQAFHELKNEYPKDFEGAELHLKTNIRTLHPAMEQMCPKLRIHSEVWPTEVLKKFYSMQHVLLAPSRGEGKNLPALEFQTTGGAVIATNWGGMASWLSPEFAYPLDYTLVPVAPTLPNCKQARASKEQLKELMMHVYQNRDEVKQKGFLASQTLPAMCSWESVVDRMFLKLAKLIPDKGEKLLLKYKMAGASNV